MKIIPFYAAAPQKFDETPVERPYVPVEFSRKPEEMERMIQYLLKQPFPVEPPVSNCVDDAEVVEEIETVSLTDGRRVKLHIAVYDKTIEAGLPPQ